MIGVVTLVVGIIIGYMGQRSRFCTISGIRDFFLVRDAYRLKGLFGIIIGGIIGFSLFGLLDGSFPAFPMTGQGLNVIPLILLPISMVGAFGMAYFSVMAEGCPFRQHVIAGEGRISGIIYVGGVVFGVIFFDIVVTPYLQLITLLG